MDICTIDQSPQSVNLLYLTGMTFYQCNVMDAPMVPAAAASDLRDKGWTDGQKALKRPSYRYCDDILLYGCWSDPQMDI